MIKNDDYWLGTIVDNLILDCSNTIDLGLYHGKTGVAISLFEYASFSKQDIYAELAEILLEEVIDSLSIETPIFFSDGLCGIGWGIEYLINQGYVTGSDDDILSEIDKKVMEIDVARIKDLSIETGLGGIAYYVYSRILFSNRTDYKLYMPFDNTYLSIWKTLIPSLLQNNQPTQKESIQLFRCLSSAIECPLKRELEVLNFPHFISLTKNDNFSINDCRFMPKGLDGGLAGLILSRIKS